MSVCIFPTPLHEQDATQDQVFKQCLTGLNSEFSFFETSRHTKINKLSLPYYMPVV